HCGAGLPLCGMGLPHCGVGLLLCGAGLSLPTYSKRHSHHALPLSAYSTPHCVVRLSLSAHRKRHSHQALPLSTCHIIGDATMRIACLVGTYLPYAPLSLGREDRKIRRFKENAYWGSIFNTPYNVREQWMYPPFAM